MKSYAYMAGKAVKMIVALEEAKRKLTALESVVAELGNQLRIEEAEERAQELERETMVQDFWLDAEKSSQKLREIKQLKDKVESYKELVSKLEDAYTLEALEAMSPEEREAAILPTERVFQDYTRVTLPDFFARLAASGCPIYLRKIGVELEVGRKVRLYRRDEFFAIGECRELEDGLAIKPTKQFLI